MAGKSHDHSMNIHIKADASGIGKVDSEIKNLNSQVDGVNGKKIDLKVSIDGNAAKTIDSVVNSIGNIEKSLNTISTKGIDALEQGFATANKAAMDLVSAIGSVQSSIDGISGRGIDALQQSEGAAVKTSQDLTSSLGQVSSAADGISGKGVDDLISKLSSATDQATQLMSQLEKASTVSGFGDNWNNSYGGRYGGMRYTGQGIGLNDVISYLSGGKSTYELTVENAMNKTRNMAVAKSWNEEDGITGMDAYWSLDKATDRSLMSLNSLAAGVNATAATTGASAKDITKHAMAFADFGTMVLGLGYTEDVAQTAIMKLGRGLHGTFAALDQYGITKESLTGARDENGNQYWNGDENDLDGYMKAVSHYSQAMSKQLMSTPTGQMATMSKSMSLGAYTAGILEAQATTGVVSAFKEADDGLRTWTKSLGIGVRVLDNAGNQVLTKENKDIIVTYDEDPKTGEKKPVYAETSMYVDANKNVLDDYGNIKYQTDKYMTGEQKAMADGFAPKISGIGLSTFLVAGQQGIEVYKTLKDTVLGTFAEIRDLRRIRQIGLRNIFKGDDYQYVDGYLQKVPKAMNNACDQVSEGCPQDGTPKTKGDSKSKKKKGRFSKWKDSIGSKIDNLKTGGGDAISNTKSKIGNKFKNFKSKLNNPESIISNPNVEGYDKPLEIQPPPGTRIRKISPTEPSEILKDGKKIRRYSGEELLRQVDATNPETVTRQTKHGTLKINKFGGEMASLDVVQPKQTISDRAKKIDKELDAKNKKVLSGKDTRYSGISNKLSNKYGNFKNKIGDTKSSLSNYFSSANKEREAAGNQYGGYMKRTNKAIYDVKNLKSKAKDYISNKKKLIQKEFASGQLKGAINKRIWGDKASGGVLGFGKRVGGTANIMGKSIMDMPKNLGWNAIKNQAQGTLVGDLGSKIANSGPFKALGSAATTMKDQVTGNAGALYGMTHGGKSFKDSKMGKRISGFKERGGVSGAIGRGASKAGGLVSKAGGKAISGASKGVGAIAGGVGKIGGLMGGIMGGLSAVLGPIGLILTAVTLITGLLDAMGVDWMGPLQTAFGGFIEALQPAIQGFGTWLADTAEKVGPVLTEIGKVLGPVLQALGGLISSGLGGLVQMLTPVFEWISGLFSGEGGEGGIFQGLGQGLQGLSDLFTKLGPVVQSFWSLVSQGAEGVGSLLGSVFDGVGMYLTHIVTEAGNTIAQFWAIVGTGISNAIQIVGGGIMTVITGIGQAAAGALGAFGGVMIALISGVAGAISMGIMGMAMAITGGIMLITQTIVQAFVGFAGTVASTTAEAYWTLELFQGRAVSKMSQIATDMVNAFKNNFTGIKEAVDAEMSGAYDSLCTWGDKMVAKAEEIGRRVANAVPDNMLINSPGLIWQSVEGEFRGAYESMASYKDPMINKAGEIGSGVANNYVTSYNRNHGENQLQMPSPPTEPIITAQQPQVKPAEMRLELPKVPAPDYMKEMKKQRQNEPQGNTYVFNLHGDMDNDERAKKFLKLVNEKLGFENKRAGRTV